MRPGITLVLALLVLPLGEAARGQINLVGHVDIPLAAYTTDVWGWVDPNTQKEYALVGNNATGLYVVDVSVPTSPSIVSTVDSVPRFDIKTWENYVYTVDGNFGNDGGIVDISDPLNPVVVGSLAPAHNLFIDEQGFLYAMQPGLRIYYLPFSPTTPIPVYENLDAAGHDATVIGDTLYYFASTDGTFIYNVANKNYPQLLGHITDPSITYHHSGWPTADGNYLVINDEFAVGNVPDFTVWDISDPSMPERVAEWGDDDATVHNSYRVGDLLFVAYYTAGFRVFNLTNALYPFMLDEYDTSLLTGEPFRGAFGAYPFTPSAHIYVSDRENGLFVFNFSYPSATAGTRPRSFEVDPIFPNPSTHPTVRVALRNDERVRVDIYNVRGERVRVLWNGSRSAGDMILTWDGRDDHGRDLPSGAYFVKVSADGDTQTQKALLLR